MGTRHAGDVVSYLPATARSSATVTTSAGVLILSVNTTGNYYFGIVNSGSTTFHLEGSFDSSFFNRIAVTRVYLATTAPLIETVAASSQGVFEGPYEVVRAYASGSGVYTPTLVRR